MSFALSQCTFKPVHNEPTEARIGYQEFQLPFAERALMKTSGAFKLRCKHVLRDQRCSSESGKPGINYILSERRVPRGLQLYLS